MYILYKAHKWVDYTSYLPSLLPTHYFTITGMHRMANADLISKILIFSQGLWLSPTLAASPLLCRSSLLSCLAYLTLLLSLSQPPKYHFSEFQFLATLSPDYALDSLFWGTSPSRALSPAPVSPLNFLNLWQGLVLECPFGCLAYNPLSYSGTLSRPNELWWGTETASLYKAEKADIHSPSCPCS